MDARRVVDVWRKRETVVLPAGGAGVFLANVTLGRVQGGSWRLYVRPRTFINSAQVGVGQRPLPPATDVGWSVLAGNWTLTGKMPDAPSAVLSQEELDEFAGVLDEEANAG